jgi:thiosulfate dehydrogenase (quinone) large subunit
VAGVLQRARRDPRWILLLLRGYLGFTFVYAGLSKVGSPSFFDSSSPGSLQATLLGVRAHSPIGGLLGPVEHHSFAFGLIIAFGETAVGAGTMLGLWARIAALGGMLISLSLFLTVSWSATPWYTGADIVYLFAFTPLLLGGAGPLSLDGWFVLRRDRDYGTGARDADLTRRVLVTGLAALGALIALGAAGLARLSSSGNTAATAGNRTMGGSAAPTTDGSTTSPTTGANLLAVSAVPVGGAAQATDPHTGDPMYVLQLRPWVFTALDAICPHQGCTVSFVSAQAGFVCPCHFSTFDTSGAVTQGPAATGLAEIPVAKSGNEIVRT